MRIGDLVHAPRYPYWGIGIVVEIGNADDVQICWFAGKMTCEAMDWHDKDYLEEL